MTIYVVWATVHYNGHAHSYISASPSLGFLGFFFNLFSYSLSALSIQPFFIQDVATCLCDGSILERALSLPSLLGLHLCSWRKSICWTGVSGLTLCFSLNLHYCLFFS